jgi:monoterpene epsilon-lactone hydrolase
MSLRAHLLELALRAIRLKRMFSGPDAIRRTVAMARRQGPALPSASFQKRFAVSRRDLAGSTVYTVAPRHAQPSRRLLYLHGGGFILPIQALHWGMIGTLVDGLDAVATIPFYPLAPEQDESAVWALLLLLCRWPCRYATPAGPLRQGWC